MTKIQIKRGKKEHLSQLSIGEFGLVTDQETDELYIGGSSQNQRVALLDDEGKIPSSELPEKIYKNPYIGEDGYWYIYVDGEYVRTDVPARGENGKDGTDGQDYILTEQDKQEIAQMVVNLIPTADDVLYGDIPSVNGVLF